MELKDTACNRIIYLADVANLGNDKIVVLI